MKAVAIGTKVVVNGSHPWLGMIVIPRETHHVSPGQSGEVCNSRRSGVTARQAPQIGGLPNLLCSYALGSSPLLVGDPSFLHMVKARNALGAKDHCGSAAGVPAQRWTFRRPQCRRTADASHDLAETIASP